jgi:hypothetical protein
MFDLIFLSIAFIIGLIIALIQDAEDNRKQQVKKRQFDRTIQQHSDRPKKPLEKQVKKNFSKPQPSRSGDKPPLIPYSRDSLSYSNLRFGKTITYTERNNLIGWALHKQPGDIQLNDYIIPPSGDVVVHREGGIVKIVKGPGAGRVLSEWELKDYLDNL